MKEILSVTRFNLSPKSKRYSRDWEYAEVYIDQETKELVTFLKARLNSTYDKETRVRL